ncbi:MAG: type II CAAX prenyl endopeptidase Rce1 family protein [Dysgonomonas sp.]
MDEIRKQFREMSSWTQLIFLGVFTFAGIILLNLIVLIAIPFFGLNPTDPIGLAGSANYIKFILLVQSPLIFLMPACLWSYMFKEKITTGLRINKFPEWQFLILGIALIFIIQPIVSFTGYYNSKLVLPEAFAPIENMMRSMEDQSAAMLKPLISDMSVSGLIINLTLIAVMAGICEEFFFRGALQQILRRIIGNYHVTVWVTAFIFSAIHLQFYGFIPRLILGALLGYLFVWSANLWVPVIMHTLNNSFSIIGYHIYGYEIMSSDSNTVFGVGDTWWATAGSGALTIFIMIYLAKLYLRRSVEEGKI